MPLKLADRWHYVLGWPLLARCALATLMYSGLELFYLIWKLYVLAFHQDLALINADVVRAHLPVSTTLFLSTVVVAWFCYYVRHHRMFESWLPYICTFGIASSMCYHGYLVGMMTPATGLIMIGLPMIGVILIGQRFVYPPLFFGVMTASIITYLSLEGQIAYAPIFRQLPMLDAQAAMFWGINIGLFCFPLLIGLILLYDFIIRQWRYSEQENKRLSQTDPLTGLFNRRSLNQYLHDVSVRSSERLSIALLDLDLFKRINDRCGHLVGDRVLQDVADVLRQHGRPSDWIGRFGGEEFILILPDTDAQTAYYLCERYREALMQLSVKSTQGESWCITGSFGVVTTMGPFDVSHTLSVVDEMLYQAKRRGRNCVVYADQVLRSSLS
jgi:diguanylate cyclase (GGDEF)-like protein